MAGVDGEAGDLGREEAARWTHTVRRADVTFVDQVTEHVEALNTSGLKLTGPVDEFTVTATAFTPDSVQGEFDAILLCTKAHHTRTAAETLKPHLKADGCVVSVQNGLNELVIQEIVGWERTVGTFINFGADYLNPGVIHFAGRGAVVLGEIDGQNTPRIERLHRLFLDFDENAIITGNIWGYLWGKQAYGAMYITRDQWVHRRCARRYEISRPVCDDCAGVLCVAQALGVGLGHSMASTPPFSTGTDPYNRGSMDDMVAFNRKSAKTHSGIWRDLAVRKRRTEVSAYDVVVSEAERLGIPMRLTARLIEMIHEIEDGKRVQDVSNLDVLKASLP
jgi:2-dehydropantoate 2-reductase